MDEDSIYTLILSEALKISQKESKQGFLNKITEIAMADKSSEHSIVSLEKLNLRLYAYLLHLADNGFDNDIDKALVENFIILHSSLSKDCLEKKSITYRKNLSISFLIAGLRYFGASKGQSVQSISLWAGIGKDKIEKAYKEFKYRTDKIKDYKMEEALITIIPHINPILHHFKDRDFPESQPRKGFICTKVAYKTLQKELDSFRKNTEIVPLYTGILTDREKLW